MKRANLLPLLALVALLSAGALAKDVRSWDIIGMRLGMSVSEIEAAAAARALLEKGRSKAPSFEQAVLIRKGHRIKGTDYDGMKMLKFASTSFKQTSLNIMHQDLAHNQSKSLDPATYVFLTSKKASLYSASKMSFIVSQNPSCHLKTVFFVTTLDRHHQRAVSKCNALLG